LTNENRLQPESTSLYFDLQADFGITKHMGGQKATRELAELCHIREGAYVLEVGCGIGTTSSYLTKEYGCQLVAVDISDKMVERARNRAQKQGVETRIEFRVADAKQLPFETGLFDVVIDESVMPFVGDKMQALSEYVRVVKPNGYIGLNEVTWVKPPQPELARYASLIMAGAVFQTCEEWMALLTNAGLREIQVRNHKFDKRSQWREETRQFELKETLRAWYRFMTQSITNPAYRRFIGQIMRAPQNMFKFMAAIEYGIYVGRK
jgi:arsenite methyltransferase